MRRLLIPLFFVVVGLQSGCAKSSLATDGSQLNGATGDATNLGQDVGNETPYVAEALSWESAKTDGKKWSDYVYKVIREEVFNDLDKAMDVEIFCPNYDQLTKNQRINFWGGLISGIAKFESGYSPTSRYQESTMGTDPVTRQPVYSEGLLQLSYQDVQWAPYCEFNWAKDKSLSPTDPKKTILDPYKNLRCGIKILAAQVKSKRQIVLSSGVYWAVLKNGGRYEKIDKIAAITQKLSFCKR